MAELTTKLVRDYFLGSWCGQVSINGEKIHNIEFSWLEDSARFSFPLINLEWRLLCDQREKEEINNQVITVWRSDMRSWVNMWYNKSGGYSEQQWTSQEDVNGITVLYGSLRERTADDGLTTEYIAMCELLDRNNFKYTILSYRNGIFEIVAKRNITH